MVYNFLFPTKPNTTKVSLFLLAVRIIFGILLMNHGIQKWSNFQELSMTFPDPLGLGSPLSLGLAIFGELVKSAFRQAEADSPCQLMRDHFPCADISGIRFARKFGDPEIAFRIEHIRLRTCASQ